MSARRDPWDELARRDRRRARSRRDAVKVVIAIGFVIMLFVMLAAMTAPPR